MQFLIKISYNLILRWNDRLPVDQSFSQFKTHLFYFYIFFTMDCNLAFRYSPQPNQQPIHWTNFFFVHNLFHYIAVLHSATHSHEQHKLWLKKEKKKINLTWLLKSQWRGSRNRSFLPYCKQTIEKEKNVGWELGSVHRFLSETADICSHDLSFFAVPCLVVSKPVW